MSCSIDSGRTVHPLHLRTHAPTHAPMHTNCWSGWFWETCQFIIQAKWKSKKLLHLSLYTVTYCLLVSIFRIIADGNCNSPQCCRARPSLYSWIPSLYSSRPCLYSSRPSLYSWRPSLYSSRPSLYSARPSLYSSRPSLYSWRALGLSAEHGRFLIFLLFCTHMHGDGMYLYMFS